MSDTAIYVENLSKQYQIGALHRRDYTLRDQLVSVTKSLFSSNRQDASNSKTIWALRDISLEVEQGEVLGVAGRNGGGKSTLLKILSRITKPTTGRAMITGRVGSLLEVGTGFHGDLTGRENTYLNGAILGMMRSEVKARFDEIVAFAEIEKFIDTPVKRYSSGMYMRLAFSVAAHLETEILLVDEVLAVGDAQFQKKCLGKMHNVAAEGRTIIFVSHNMQAIESLCSKAILLEHGKITLSGSPHNVIARYLEVGLKEAGEVVWNDITTAPGHDIVRLRAVRVLDASNQVRSEFKLTEPFDVEIEFSVLTDGHSLTCGIYCYDTAHNLLFVAIDSQDPTWQHRVRPKGIYTTRCHVPANFMSDGIISLSIVMAAPPRGLHMIAEDVIFVRLVDTWEAGGARGTYMYGWPGGVVRPMLKWSFDFRPK